MAQKGEFSMPNPFEWVKIPAGKVTLEDGHGKFDVAAFEMSKYPITNAQFALFVQDGGYKDQQWWTEPGWQTREEKKWLEPRFWQDQTWNGADTPVVGVSWYEAVAFCRWWGAKAGDNILLPTEQQWQWAAQGKDGRVYPWGNEWDTQKCNNKATGIGKTTPVTQYPQGASPYGVMDMSGNVWEWASTTYEDASNNNINNNAMRVLRGGSWNSYNSHNFRVTFRLWDYPLSRNYGRGFRCARSS